MKRRFLLFATIAVCACIAGEPAVNDADSQPDFVPDSARTASATRVLTAYLEASRESSYSSVAIDTLAACEGAAETHFPALLLARWVLLPMQARGDTVVARAEVTTVAEIDMNRRDGSLIGRQRVRNDILEWDVYEDEYGNWVVCNGLRFGYRGPREAVMWRPEMASFESVRALADSLANSTHAR